MKFEKIKNTDIEVSKICLGGMSFGKAGSMHDWTLDERSSERIIKHALNNNINFEYPLIGYFFIFLGNFIVMAIKVKKWLVNELYFTKK